MRESMPTQHAPTQHAGGPGNIGASLRTIFSIGTLSGLSDGQLLERFAQGQGEMPESEAAFTAAGWAPMGRWCSASAGP